MRGSAASASASASAPASASAASHAHVTAYDAPPSNAVAAATASTKPCTKPYTTQHPCPPRPRPHPTHDPPNPTRFFEVILVDVQHKTVRVDPKINWLCNPVHKHRECRGLTSAGRKGRGFRKGGHRANNRIGGSSFAAWKRRNNLSLRRYR